MFTSLPVKELVEWGNRDSCFSDFRQVSERAAVWLSPRWAGTLGHSRTPGAHGGAFSD